MVLFHIFWTRKVPFLFTEYPFVSSMASLKAVAYNSTYDRVNIVKIGEDYE